MAADYIGVDKLALYTLAFVIAVMLGVGALISLIKNKRWPHVAATLGGALVITVLAEAMAHLLVLADCGSTAPPTCASDRYFWGLVLSLGTATPLSALAAWMHATWSNTSNRQPANQSGEGN